MKILLFIALFSFYSSANASTCVDVDLNGYLVTTSESVDDCTTSVILTKDEYTKATYTFGLFSMTKEESYELSSAFY